MGVLIASILKSADSRRGAQIGVWLRDLEVPDPDLCQTVTPTPRRCWQDACECEKPGHAPRVLGASPCFSARVATRFDRKPVKAFAPAELNYRNSAAVTFH